MDDATLADLAADLDSEQAAHDLARDLLALHGPGGVGAELRRRVAAGEIDADAVERVERVVSGPRFSGHAVVDGTTGGIALLAGPALDDDGIDRYVVEANTPDGYQRIYQLNLNDVGEYGDPPDWDDVAAEALILATALQDALHLRAQHDEEEPEVWASDAFTIIEDHLTGPISMLGRIASIRAESTKTEASLEQTIRWAAGWAALLDEAWIDIPIIRVIERSGYNGEPNNALLEQLRQFETDGEQLAALDADAGTAHAAAHDFGFPSPAVRWARRELSGGLAVCGDRVHVIGKDHQVLDAMTGQTVRRAKPKNPVWEIFPLDDGTFLVEYFGGRIARANSHLQPLWSCAGRNPVWGPTHVLVDRGKRDKPTLLHCVSVDAGESLWQLKPTRDRPQLEAVGFAAGLAWVTRTNSYNSVLVGVNGDGEIVAECPIGRCRGGTVVGDALVFPHGWISASAPGSERRSKTVPVATCARGTLWQARSPTRYGIGDENGPHWMAAGPQRTHRGQSDWQYAAGAFFANTPSGLVAVDGDTRATHVFEYQTTVHRPITGDGMLLVRARPTEHGTQWLACLEPDILLDSVRNNL